MKKNRNEQNEQEMEESTTQSIGNSQYGRQPSIDPEFGSENPLSAITSSGAQPEELTTSAV